MRRNFPRPYTTTYLRAVVVGQLVALADSEITAILQVVLTGFVTVSFHSIRVAVSFDAVSAHAQPVLSLQSASPSCHAPSILSLLTGIASARPSALVEGDGLEPSLCCRTVSVLCVHLLPCFAAASPLSQPSKILSWYLSFRLINRRTSQRADCSFFETSIPI